ncbi:MAG: CPBP family intramembrane metalloprotease [Oscillospiraceae bacterium]|nr:CPBP family intramembrane metalloprotease [Oscillospiraceae bacterium]
MAGKKAPSTSLTHGETVSGLIFFAVYYLVMPFALTPLLNGIGKVLGTSIGSSLGNLLYYFVLFVVTLAIFWHFLGVNLAALGRHLNRSCISLAAGLIAFYGLNELLYRVSSALLDSHVNLNDVTITAQAGIAPHMMAVILILLAPFVEEILFRGLIFGSLRKNSRAVAYIISALLFAFGHVLRQVTLGLDLGALTLIFQYLAPGLVFAWVYERAGNIWPSVLLHALVNALAFFVIII